MGIQINGQTDTISAIDGALTVSGADLPTVTNLNATGIVTATGFVGNLTGNLNSSGVSTFADGPVLIGSGTSTGTASQRLQVTGGAYVSGSTGIGTINPALRLTVYDGVDTTFTNCPVNLQIANSGTIATGLGAGINFSARYDSNNLTTYATISGIRENATNANSAGALTFGVRDSGAGTSIERARLTSSGYLGIGTNNPTTEFEVLGAGTVASFRGTGGSSFIGIKDEDDGTIGFIGVDGGSIKLQTSGSSYADKIVVDSSGRVTMPYQPAFQAYGDGSYTTYSANAEITKFTFTTYNIGSHYNSTTCRFTAPVAGVYLFTATIITETDQSGSLTFAINGTDPNAQARMYMTAERGRSNSIILQLAVNDYVSLFARDSNLRIYGVTYSGFSGVLLG